jgi:biotin transport system substrate-specific component
MRLTRAGSGAAGKVPEIILETRNLVRIALLAAFIAALGLLPRLDLPIAAGVPITAQTLGVMLAGLLLGARNGALAVALFLFVVALGAPFLAGGRGGVGVFFGPTAGYLVGWMFGAFATGWLMNALPLRSRFARAITASLVGGVLVIYAFGIPYLAFAARLDLWKALVAGSVFMPGDVLKAVAAALIVRSLPAERPSTSA